MLLLVIKITCMPLWIHISVVDNGVLPSKYFIEEVKDYFEEQKRENSAERNARRTSDNTGMHNPMIPKNIKHYVIFMQLLIVEIQSHYRHTYGITG